MSPLICKENKESKIRWIDIEPMGVTIIIGLLASVVLSLGSVILILPFALSILGFVLLIISKISLFRQGIWGSFGSKLMTKGYARLYKLSYILIGIGVLFLLLLAKSIT